MNNLTIQLDGEALRDATVQAMAGVLSPEVKAQMVENAIVSILRPSQNSWERNKSFIELAFEEGVKKVANAEAKRLVESDEVLRQRITELLRITADKVLAADLEKLAERMANAFVESMRSN